ncbi:MAG: peptidase M23 [Lysobacterales bacterium 69-70]|nr:M23 family metallopeptidase [Xanthomonadaceae bacterium]ODU34794.1 MAG: peptidase M23 [Xanthomonadaceae bacterium SCN 69-320]ODV19688.1 MAG: peptidase M23 [Xanthomonadaceae bacterium SCN 69-25]OJY95047.1 MAG: peptidase M23 [Xanthomonadales bacterium 69-70]
MRRNARRRPSLLLVCLLCLPAAGLAAALPARVQQGQLIAASTEPGSAVRIGEREARVDADGRYVFGIERDAPASVTVTIRHRNGKTEQHSLQVVQREYKIERVDGLPPHTVTPDPDLARRIAEEQARVAKARERDDDRTDYLGGFRRPAEGRISGVYGSQRIDNGVPKAPHYGLDIAVPTGTPVKAPAGGIVSFAAPDLILTGGTVLIDHGHGLTSSFLHLSRINVKLGDRVSQGQVFAAAGATGRASGPHVHWGFNWFDVRLDPALLPAAAAARK